MFCRIARGEIPAEDGRRDGKDSWPSGTSNPQAPTHVLVIPREARRLARRCQRCRVSLGRMLSLAAAIARQEGIAKSGYRTVINTGKDGGQTVDHLHIHVLGGRRMTWPPG